jgi:chemotaxis protein methyltransferase CheR
MTLPLTPALLAILTHLIEERTGLHYGPEHKDILADKLTRRADERGLDSLLDYYYFLRYDEAAGAELTRLVDALVVNETYFYREEEQLRVLVRTLLPRLRDGDRPLRVWCAACSTGEEPLTLAMILEEEKARDRVEIVASDVSTRALARARAGVYSGRAFRVISDTARERFMTRADSDALRVRDHVRERIEWRHVNLLDEGAIAALGVFDVIVTRNVLIYFRDETIVRVVTSLGGALRPGGYLLVGASESLLRFGTQFHCEEHGGAFFYRKDHA